MQKSMFFLFSLILSFSAHAKWQLEKTNWLSDSYYSLFHAGSKSGTGFFLSTNNMENMQFHMLLSESSLEKQGDKFPFVVKGDIYFDGNKYATYQLTNDLNVNKYKGVDYKFDESFLDSDVYEKLKQSKKMTFRYTGKRGLDHRISIPLENYYTQFNEFTTQRMFHIVPSFLDYKGKQKYQKMVGRCIALAKGQVDDIRARNTNQPLPERLTVVLQSKKTYLVNDIEVKFDEADLISRVGQAYEFYGDTNQPEWLLYGFFSTCYNKAIDSFQA